MTALEDQAVVSKGKEDLQIMSAACAVTLLAALRAAFMLPQQREGLPRVCNVPFRMLRAGSGGDRGRGQFCGALGLTQLWRWREAWISDDMMGKVSAGQPGTLLDCLLGISDLMRQEAL